MRGNIDGLIWRTRGVPFPGVMTMNGYMHRRNQRALTFVLRDKSLARTRLLVLLIMVLVFKYTIL